MSSYRFSKQLRLLRLSEFERVFALRMSAVDPRIVLYGASNEVNHPRLGLVVSRRVGGAVQRNRWKRLLREAFRLSVEQLPAIDLVCVVRCQTPPPLTELKESLTQLAARVDDKVQKAVRHSARKV
jgi:ribonuclease P protein component